MNIVPGFLCNMSCSHCVSNSGPDRNHSGLTQAELDSIISEIKESCPDQLTFTGGEPTLYIELINRITACIPSTARCDIKITSNGKFATSVESAKRVLATINGISTFFMSFDNFHQNSVGISNVHNLFKATKDLGIEFKVVTSISNLLQVARITKMINNPDISVIFQPTIRAGRAKVTGSTFKYPQFQPSVLAKKCPNLDSITFIPKRGFTTCCSSVVFNNEITDVAQPTIADHLKSSFYKHLSINTFGELAKMVGISPDTLDGDCSAECNLCEKLFKKWAGI